MLPLAIFGFLNFTFVDIIDILVVALIIYVVFKWLKGSSAMSIFVAIIILLLIRVIAVALNMKMLSALLGTVIDVGAIALVVIFQPEIRHFLTHMGRRAGFEKNRLFRKLLGQETSALGNGSVSELADACAEMGEQKTGALIVLLKRDALAEIIDTGDRLDANIGKHLIENIFFKNSPLHDGAMVIGEGRIVAARCTLPITQKEIPARYGMRHKAAVGLSEISDADVIVVSEETGRISFVRDGEITPVRSKNELVLLLGSEVEKEEK